MSSRASKRVSFSPDVNDKPTVFLNHEGNKKLSGNRRRVSVEIFSFRVPKSSKFSPGRLLRRLGAKMSRTLCFLSTPRRSSCKVSSSTLQRSRSLADSIDSHRAEAIEDCIEFFNTSSTMSRSNSVSASSCQNFCTQMDKAYKGNQ